MILNFGNVLIRHLFLHTCNYLLEWLNTSHPAVKSLILTGDSQCRDLSARVSWLSNARHTLLQLIRVDEGLT